MTPIGQITRDLFHSMANIWYHQCINLITDSELTLVSIIMDEDEMQNVSGMCQVLLTLFGKILHEKDDIRKKWLVSKKQKDKGGSKKQGWGACKVGKTIWLHNTNDKETA